MWDTILEVLKDRVNDGVEVRFMYDDVGCVDLLLINITKSLSGLGSWRCHLIRSNHLFQRHGITEIIEK